MEREQLIKRRILKDELCEVEDEIMRHQIPAMEWHEYLDNLKAIGPLFDKRLSPAERKKFLKGCSRIQAEIKKFVLHCNKMRNRISRIQ